MAPGTWGRLKTQSRVAGLVRGDLKLEGFMINRSCGQQFQILSEWGLGRQDFLRRGRTLADKGDPVPLAETTPYEWLAQSGNTSNSNEGIPEAPSAKSATVNRHKTYDERERRALRPGPRKTFGSGAIQLL